MEQPIAIRFRWTADDLFQTQRYHFRHTCRPAFRLGLNFLFAVVLVGGVLMLMTSGPAGKAPLLVSISFLIVGIYWFTLRRFEKRWMIRRKFNKDYKQNQETEWKFTADKINTQSDIGQSEVAWLAFTKMVQTPTGVMLYSNDQIYHWLPRRCFANDTEFQRFVELAKSKVQKHYDVD